MSVVHKVQGCFIGGDCTEAWLGVLWFFGWSFKRKTRAGGGSILYTYSSCTYKVIEMEVIKVKNRSDKKDKYSLCLFLSVIEVL